jgi:hypothetical protein
VQANVPVSFRVAVEHFNWAKRAGMSNAEIMASLSLTSSKLPNDTAVIDAIERTWLALQLGFKARPVAGNMHHSRRAAE